MKCVPVLVPCVHIEQIPVQAFVFQINNFLLQYKTVLLQLWSCLCVCQLTIPVPASYFGNVTPRGFSSLILKAHFHLSMTHVKLHACLGEGLLIVNPRLSEYNVRNVKTTFSPLSISRTHNFVLV